MAASDQSLARPLSALAWQTGRYFSDLQVSPAGTDVSYVCRTDRTRELVIRRIDGADATLPLDPALGSGGHAWLPDGSGIVYAAIDDRLYRLDFDTSAIVGLTPHGEKASAPQVSPDGAEVVYVVDDLASIAVASTSGTGYPRSVTSDADFVIDPVWSPDGGTIAWVEWNVPNMAWDSSRLMVRDARCSTPARFVAGGEDVSVQQPRFSPDGEKLAYLCDQTGWLNVWSVDAGTWRDAEPVVEETFEHGAPTWSSRQHSFAWVNDATVALTRNDGGWSRLVSCDVESGAVVQLDDDGATTVVANAGVLAAITAGPVSPVTVTSYQGGAKRVLTQATPTGVTSHGHRPQSISWRAPDGVEIHGRFYEAGQRSPLLVFTHGGPTSQSPVTLHGRFSYFIERGWSVFVPDHRGTTGWGRAYQQAMRGRWGELDVSDVASGVAHVVSEGLCDASKVVAIGGSAGGFTTLSLLAKHGELFAAGVVQYPVCDLVELAWTTWRFEAHYLDSLIGPLPDAREEYISRSPLQHADKIRSPLLILQGDGDEVVAIDQVRAMAGAVEGNGALVEMHVYQGEGHGWRRGETRADELERVDEFLRKHVLHVGPRPEGCK